MGRLQKKGEAGAAKAYITRTAAVRKLQCSLADFRRLCILKGIFPREPRSRKRANKGSSASTSFYYAKDIAYLAHEPVLKKLREHKSFAKKLSRALGRGEWSSAKSLEENKPVYRIDHIIKERYPTFIDAVRDIDDALCMIFLFSTLPSNSQLPPQIIENCARLAAEWQLYIIQTKSLRKVFLSIKGVYYQAEVMDQTVNWLVPYQFTQNIPADVDVRVMLTFLELYQTLLGFVFFKLYTDRNLVYPPPLDIKKDEGAAGFDAFSLQEALSPPIPKFQNPKVVEIDGRKISGKDVRHTIQTIASSSELNNGDVHLMNAEPDAIDVDEDFVAQSSVQTDSTELPTLKSLSILPLSSNATLFTPYTFFLSRETSRSIFEFLVRSFGGHIGWPPSSGSGSLMDENDDSITHVIIDRPLVEKNETSIERERRLKRKYVQPQWIVDCINAGRVLPEEPYAQGKILPPHLSPFGEHEGAYDPTAGQEDMESLPRPSALQGIEDKNDKESDSESESMLEATAGNALEPTMVDPIDDPISLRTAELAAEAAGVDYGTFEKSIQASGKKNAAKAHKEAEGEKDMNKMMMSNKQRKLYEKMKYSQKKREAERKALEAKKKLIQKQRRKEKAA